MSEYSDSFQKKMGSGDFANAINCHIPISYGWMKIATPRLGIIKASCIIGFPQTSNQDFENNICRHLLNILNDIIVEVLRFSWIISLI